MYRAKHTVEPRPLRRALAVFALTTLALGVTACEIRPVQTYPAGTVFTDGAASGGFFLTWSTSDSATGREIDCVAELNASHLIFRAFNTSTGQTFVTPLPCNDRVGLTSAVTAGVYQITLELAQCGLDPTCLNGPQIIRSDIFQQAYSAFSSAALDLGNVVLSYDVGFVLTPRKLRITRPPAGDDLQPSGADVTSASGALSL
jgi:hypothetical protein